MVGSNPPAATNKSMKKSIERQPQYSQLQTCENILSSIRFNWLHHVITEDELKCRIKELCDQLEQI